MPTPGELIRKIACRCSSSLGSTRRCDFCDVALVLPEAENTIHQADCPIMTLWMLVCDLSHSVTDKLEEITGLWASLIEAQEETDRLQADLDSLHAVPS